MTQALDQSIAELLHASRDDEAILELEVADRIFGFHAQQAVEKLLKAVIGAHGERFEHTHDLGTLVRHAEGLGKRYEIKEPLLKFLTAYAGVWRYEDPIRSLRVNVSSYVSWLSRRRLIRCNGFVPCVLKLIGPRLNRTF